MPEEHDARKRVLAAVLRWVVCGPDPTPRRSGFMICCAVPQLTTNQLASPAAGEFWWGAAVPAQLR